MDDKRERQLIDRAEANHCVFVMRDISELSLDEIWRDTRLTQGRIVAVHRGVYRFAGSVLSPKGHLLAAVLAAGPTARASHRSAAMLHGLTGARHDIVEVTCRRWRRARRDDVVVHESKQFDPVDHTEVEGIPVTTALRTLLDLGAVTSRLVVDMALDDALRKDLVTTVQVRELLRRLGRQGRNGSGVLRRVMTTRPAGRPAESPQERRMVRMLERNGLPSPVLQHEVMMGGVFVARVDAAFPEWRVAIEYDSYEFHVGKVAHVRDNNRRLALRRAGWESVGVTAVDLRDGCRSVSATIRQIISERSSSGVDFQV